jgi:hypothetical protein
MSSRLPAGQREEKRKTIAPNRNIGLKRLPIFLRFCKDGRFYESAGNSSAVSSNGAIGIDALAMFPSKVL